MKHSLIVFLAFAAIASSSCTKSNNSQVDPVQVVSSGTWRVTLFSDSGNNETASFSGYTFSFGIGGVITVSKDGLNKTGSWNVSDNSTKFNINLGPKDISNQPLGELSDDWKILSSTTAEIRLGDDNSSSNEFLTF